MLWDSIRDVAISLDSEDVVNLLPDISWSDKQCHEVLSRHRCQTARCLGADMARCGRAA